jgi:hypothetical protein
VIHPLVLLSVVDHASRVPLSRNKRVLGVLLGQDNGNTINVANSYVSFTSVGHLAVAVVASLAGLRGEGRYWRGCRGDGASLFRVVKTVSG